MCEILRPSRPNKNNQHVFLIVAIIFLSPAVVRGQVDSAYVNHEDVIGIRARAYSDSIVLRWAPLSFDVWEEGNKNGYALERVTMVRNGKVLKEPERIMLTKQPLRPLPEESWTRSLPRNRYAAIAAQALFGGRFEIDVKHSDVFSIVNKVKENENRYSFALFCADMSPEVAAMSGLKFTDRAVKANERYLYIVRLSTDEKSNGGISASISDSYFLPKIETLNVEFRNGAINLKWLRPYLNPYCAYVIERSVNGENFERISEIPMLTLTNPEGDNRFEYASDTVTNQNAKVFYRVLGLTAFGETGPPSDVATPSYTQVLSQVPTIKSCSSSDNQSITIAWEFPASERHLVDGFFIERMERPNTTPIRIHQNLLSRDLREFEDKMPNHKNYYRIAVKGLNGELLRSGLFYSQLIDSIPPGAPSGLTAVVDEQGVVSLSWNANLESDISGYRIYRSNFLSEEFSQVTSEPLSSTTYRDSIKLERLNKVIFYSIMAVDVNQNHSRLSEVVKIQLPDLVKPEPPVILPLQQEPTAIKISWIRSPSDDVATYSIYKKDGTNWRAIGNVKATQDTVYNFMDKLVGSRTVYTIIAIDRNGLESEPATPVEGGLKDHSLKPAITWNKEKVNREKNEVWLSWKYNLTNVKYYYVYRSVDTESTLLYKSVPGNRKEISDRLIPGKRYSYKIVALFDDGRKSFFSNDLIISY